jgi:benzoyl-CoA reductase/2-hydroxyglutaryl-CoA dehydratase subunit BcrC/BadD/HgdB
MLENPDIVAIIEDCGGRVAARDLCVTGRQAEQPIYLTGDPLLALARHYLSRPPCARMQDVQRRIEYVLGLVRSHKAQGVIYYVLKFCDTFLYEAPVLKQRLDQVGIPMLIVESEYRKGRGGSMQTRIQAFLEMLNGNMSRDQRGTDL